MNIRQLHLKFPPNVQSPEIKKAIRDIFAEYGRRGGRMAKVTDERRESAKKLMKEINQRRSAAQRELLYTIMERQKLMKKLGLKPTGKEHVYYNENDPMVKDLIAIKEKVTRLERYIKRKPDASSSRARVLAREK